MDRKEAVKLARGWVEYASLEGQELSEEENEEMFQKWVKFLMEEE